MTFTDLAKSHVRTVVPYLVGLVVAVAARHGVKLDAQETAALTVLVGSVYFAAARLLERYVSPRFGWLLGLAQQPVYAKVTTRKDAPNPLFYFGNNTAGFTTSPAGYSVYTSYNLTDASTGATIGATIGSVVANPSLGLDYRVPTAAPVVTVVVPERKVKGKRLGRHVHFDERSRAYAVQAADLSTLVSVRHKRHVPPFDQGNLGSCTGNACAGALSTAPFTHRFTERKAVQIYEAATRIDDVPGSYPPDDTGSSGLAVAKAAQQAGYVTGYQHCFDLPAVLTALQTGPVMLGVSWRTGFDQPNAAGQMAYTGSVRGGHEICADEIDVVNKRVWITNSWSSSWGVNGRAWWSWADLGKILADSGDATVLVR